MLAIKRIDGKYFRFGIEGETTWVDDPFFASQFNDQDAWTFDKFSKLIKGHHNVKLVRLTIVEEEYVRN